MIRATTGHIQDSINTQQPCSSLSLTTNKIHIGWLQHVYEGSFRLVQEDHQNVIESLIPVEEVYDCLLGSVFTGVSCADLQGYQLCPVFVILYWKSIDCS